MIADEMVLQKPQLASLRWSFPTLATIDNRRSIVLDMVRRKALGALDPLWRIEQDKPFHRLF